VWIGNPFVRARAGNGLPLALFLDTANAGSVIAQALAGAAGFRGGRYGEMEVAGAGGTRRGIRGCRPARGWRAGTVRRTAGPTSAGVAFAGAHRRSALKRCIDKRSRGDRFPGRRVLHFGRAMSPTILDELSDTADRDQRPCRARAAGCRARRESTTSSRSKVSPP
jgi:hypothetical protein